MIPPRPLPGALFIAVIGIGLGLGYNALRPQPLSWIAAKPKPIPTLESLQAHPDSATTQAVALPGADPTPPATSKMPEQTVSPRSDSSPGSRQHMNPGPEKVATGAIGNQTREIVRTRSDTTQAMTASATTSAPKETTAAVSSARDAFPDIPQSEDPIRIKLAQAKGFYDRGGMLILDARDPDDYSEGHISGAISAPSDAKVGDIEWLKTTAKDPRPIMVYCSGGDCTLSIDLGNELTRTGHRRVLVFEDGFPAWQTAGYPVQKGTTP